MVSILPSTCRLLIRSSFLWIEALRVHMCRLCYLRTSGFLPAASTHGLDPRKCSRWDSFIETLSNLYVWAPNQEIHLKLERGAFTAAPHVYDSVPFQLRIKFPAKQLRFRCSLAQRLNNFLIIGWKTLQICLRI
jgi:hypothetical protein